MIGMIIHRNLLVKFFLIGQKNSKIEDIKKKQLKDDIEDSKKSILNRKSN